MKNIKEIASGDKYVPWETLAGSIDDNFTELNSGKVNTSSISQSTGSSSTAVMSQKAITDKLTELDKVYITTLDITTLTNGEAVTSEQQTEVTNVFATNKPVICPTAGLYTKDTEDIWDKYILCVKEGILYAASIDGTKWFTYQYDIRNKAFSSGYVECTTSATDTEKLISVTGMYALSTGIRLLVKMKNNNTANSATLKINALGAKALYYNGSIVSADNTWEAGAVLDVYYNGANFQATDFTGKKTTVEGGVEDVPVYQDYRRSAFFERRNGGWYVRNYYAGGDLGLIQSASDSANLNNALGPYSEFMQAVDAYVNIFTSFYTKDGKSYPGYIPIYYNKRSAENTINIYWIVESKITNIIVDISGSAWGNILEFTQVDLKTIGSGGSSAVGKVDPNSNGTGEIFNDYTGGSKATGRYSHAEGQYATASGRYSHAEGHSATASGSASHAEGYYTKATNDGSHAGGYETTASGRFSRSTGDHTIAENYAQVSIGATNIRDNNPSVESLNLENRALVIGNGHYDDYGGSTYGDAFRVFFNGKVESDLNYSTPAADYAEMFEWKDGNTNHEDRVGLFVTLEGENIVLANSDSAYILGIISAVPAVLGDSPIQWQGKYLNDEWGRPIYEDVEYTEVKKVVKEDGTIEEVKEKRPAHIRKINPDYDQDETYESRADRPEWDAVGMLGKLLVKHDGTLIKGGFCKPSDNGVATKSDSGYYVMKVVNDHQALVLFR